MFYSKLGNNKWLIRIKRNEKIIDSIKKFCLTQKINSAQLSGIGACDYAKIGAYVFSEEQYVSNEYTGDFEILSISGNITKIDKDYYPHIHIILGNKENKTYGGHLFEAKISATCEIFLETFPNELIRIKDEETGLNLIRLDNEMKITEN